MFFNLIEQHSRFLLHTLQVLYMCTLCDSTNINTIIEFVPHVSGDGFNGGSDSYLQFRDTRTPCLLKLCTPPSNGIVRWWLFPEFGAELIVPRQSFWITLYIYIYILYIRICQERLRRTTNNLSKQYRVRLEPWTSGIKHANFNQVKLLTLYKRSKGQ